jgi:hypothetical protein
MTSTGTLSVVTNSSLLLRLVGVASAIWLMNYALVQADDSRQRILELRTIDASRVGMTMPDSSAAIDIDGEGQVEIFSSMQDVEGHPEVFLYNRTENDQWERTRIGHFTDYREEIEWVAIGRPFPDDDRVCVAASIQHKPDGLVVMRLRDEELSPFDSDHWEQGVAKEFAGQGLAFRDLTGDGVDELIYCTQAGNELGILRINGQADPMSKAGWDDHVIDTGNDRSWWWLDGKFYDLNGNGASTDFFVSTRRYGGKDLGMWKVTQSEPNDLSSYEVEKIYEGDAMNFDTGYFFSDERQRIPDIVMLSKDDKRVCLLDGRRDFAVHDIPFDGVPWNIKVFPVLRARSDRDPFVLATANSSSLFWSYRWSDGAYEIWPETGHAGDYGHPMDGTFTLADVDNDGELECIVPDSSPSPRSKGLAYLKAIPASSDGVYHRPSDRFTLEDGHAQRIGGE